MRLGMKDKMPGFAEELPPMLLFSLSPRETGILRLGLLQGSGRGNSPASHRVSLALSDRSGAAVFRREFGATADRDKRALLGYSLGGLFACGQPGRLKHSDGMLLFQALSVV